MRRLWDVASGCCTATLEGHRSYVLCVAVSGDGRTAASGCGQLFSSDKSVKWVVGRVRSVCMGTAVCVEHLSVS